MQLKTFGIYEFGPFRLEASEHRLLRDGQPVPLTPKSLELLLYLVENHGRLVLKEQIMAAVWPDSFVEEANLTVSISALRKALGQSAPGLSYVETVPKKGYRFNAPVKEVKSAEQPDLILPDQPPQTNAGQHTRAAMWSHRFAIPALVLVACVLLAIAYLVQQKKAASSASHSLAILPLRNLRQDPANDFLGFSLADAVITKLGSINSLTVRPSSTVEKYKGQAVDPAKVAAELNVDTILAGNFIREGDQLRITYQLIDAKTDRILGRDMIDVKFDKLLTVQDDVAREIIKGLELNLTPSEASRMNARQPVSRSPTSTICGAWISWAITIFR